MESSIDINVKAWKLKQEINFLKGAQGDGTSLISIAMPPNSQIPQMQNKLASEYGTATNIKSRVNKLSVLGAITSVQQKLKTYSKIPKNGLVIYCGTIFTQKGDKKVCIDIEPFKPINTTLYFCDNKFHVEPLEELLQSNETYGFIVVNGGNTIFATLSGNTKTIKDEIKENLPKKHNKGGQSAARFSRLGEEARHNYIRKVAEKAVTNFISNDKVTVSGIIIAGSADLKEVLSKSDLLDERLRKKVIAIVDIGYKGKNGLNQAIELSEEHLKDVGLVKEKKLLQKYFEHVSKDSKLISVGIKETMIAFNNGVVETLIVYENLNLKRVVINGKVEYLTPTELDKLLKTQKIEENTSLVDWLFDHYNDHKTLLEFVSDGCTQASQFIKGYQGIGAILRYPFVFDFDDNDITTDSKDDLEDDFI